MYFYSHFFNQCNKYSFERPNHVLAICYIKILLSTNKSDIENTPPIHSYVYMCVNAYIYIERERREVRRE